jgi:multidrug efflux pump subunit AcrB
LRCRDRAGCVYPISGRLRTRAAEPRLFACLDTQPIVAFSIYRAKGESDTRVADLVAEKVDELRADHPDYSIQLIDRSVNCTVGNYQSAMEGLLEGAVLAVLVVFLFLRDWRATIISAIALPLSALPTFWAMSLMGFSLNLAIASQLVGDHAGDRRPCRRCDC